VRALKELTGQAAVERQDRISWKRGVQAGRAMERNDMRNIISPLQLEVTAHWLHRQKEEWPTAATAAYQLEELAEEMREPKDSPYISAHRRKQ
jgi:hypothetical protein